jgi:hypothetical protein
VSELLQQKALSSQATAVLGGHPAVRTVTPFGSLASVEADGYPADEYSDVDLRVDVAGVSDRVFLLDELPGLIRQCGEVAATAWVILPGRYGVQYWFDDRSPFCGLDIACHSDVHEDGSDVREATRWTRPFADWLLVAKRLLRLSDLATEFVAVPCGSTPDLISPVLPVLEKLLDDARESARDRGVDPGDLEALCRRGLSEVEQRARAQAIWQDR